MTKSETSPRAPSSRDSAEELAMLKRIEAELVVEKIRAQKTAAELAAEHLGIYGGGYLCFMVGLFFASILFLPSEAVSVCAGLTTLIVTSMIQLLKQVVGEQVAKEANDK